MSPTCKVVSYNNMPNPRQQKVAFEACLVGQVFFISSTSYKADHIAKNIVLLGGRTELFFSKNVTSLLVDDYYVNEFKTQCQKFSQNVSIPEAKDVTKQCNPVYHLPKAQELINLGPSTHFQANIGLPASFPANGDLSKVCNLNQNQMKNDGYSKLSLLATYPTGDKQVDPYKNHCQVKNEGIAKFNLLASCPPNIDQFGKLTAIPYYQSETNELKKLAMLTACTTKDGDHTGFAPASCYQSTKFIPLNAVQTFNNGLGAVSISSSRGYSVFMSSKLKQDKIMQEHSVFRLMQRAHQWGISIIGICQFMQTVEMYLSGDFNKPKRRARTTNKIILSGCFLKVEDAARKYKAFYKILKEDPIKYLPLHNKFISRQVEICGSAIKFVAEILNIIEGLLRGTIAVTIPTLDIKSKARKCIVKQEQTVKILPKARKKQNHFCECCNVYFSDFTHVFSERHKAFANNEKNYECIKEVMRTLPTIQDFLHKHTQSSENDIVSLPFPACDIPHFVKVDNSIQIDTADTVIVSALDYTKKGLCQHKASENNDSVHPYPYMPNYNKTDVIVDEAVTNIIDFSIDKCLLFDDLAALGTLTPTIDDSQIKFEFDDDCWIDPLCPKDSPGELTEDRFRELSQHCQKLLVDAQILPPNDIPLIQVPLQSTQCSLQDNQESNSTALNLSCFQPNGKEETNICNTQTGTLDFSSTSQTIDKFNLSSKVSTTDTKPSNLEINTTNTFKDSQNNTAGDIIGSVLEEKNIKREHAKSCAEQRFEHLIDVNGYNCNILPTTEKKMFSSDSSDSPCGKNDFIGDVLTRIDSFDVESRNVVSHRKPACSQFQTLSPLESAPQVKRSRRKPLSKRKLPSLWSVSIVPSKTIRMKFTCLSNAEANAGQSSYNENPRICPRGGDSHVL